MASDIKTPLGNAPLFPVILVIAGGYLAWFGIHYWRTDVKYPTAPVKAVLTGNALPGNTAPSTHEAELTADVAALSPDTTGGGAAGVGGTGGATGSQIADDALKYVGAGYVYGGNASQPGNWDCSSFVSYVLGHDLGMGLPGGHWGDPGFPPNAHGPTTLTYLVFGSAINAQQVQAGDLVVYNTHMGIATSATEMISARDPQDGTGTDTISGMTASLGETVHFRRVG